MLLSFMEINTLGVFCRRKTSIPMVGYWSCVLCMCPSNQYWCLCVAEMILMAYLKRARDRITEIKKVSWNCTPSTLAQLVLFTITSLPTSFFTCPCYSHQTYTEPSSAKLLPDHLPYPYQRPYTLIMDLNYFLLHSDYDV